jgi:hypothetical protein
MQAFKSNYVSRQFCSAQGSHYTPEICRTSVLLKHPDLVPLDYYLFYNLKKHLKGRKFSSTEEATFPMDGWFAAQPRIIFLG